MPVQCSKSRRCQVYLWQQIYQPLFNLVALGPVSTNTLVELRGRDEPKRAQEDQCDRQGKHVWPKTLLSYESDDRRRHQQHDVGHLRTLVLVVTRLLPLLLPEY